MVQSKKFVISGRVQGVGFRYHTCHEGLKLHLTGYAKNLADGDVEVVACGKREQIEQLAKWLMKGPKTARVEGVIEMDVAFKAYPSFDIL